MSYQTADIVRIIGIRDQGLYEIVSKHEHDELYYVTNDECVSEILLPARLFTLVCKAKNREDV